MVSSDTLLSHRDLRTSSSRHRTLRQTPRNFNKLQRELDEARAQINGMQLAGLMGKRAAFSTREIEIGKLVIGGIPNKEIADLVRPRITVRTVEKHRQRIMKKATNLVKVLVGPEAKIDKAILLTSVFLQLGYWQPLFPELQILRAPELRTVDPGVPSLFRGFTSRQ